MTLKCNTLCMLALKKNQMKSKVRLFHFSTNHCVGTKTFYLLEQHLRYIQVWNCQNMIDISPTVARSTPKFTEISFLCKIQCFGINVFSPSHSQNNIYRIWFYMLTFGCSTNWTVSSLFLLFYVILRSFYYFGFWSDCFGVNINQFTPSELFSFWGSAFYLFEILYILGFSIWAQFNNACNLMFSADEVTHSNNPRK